MAMGTALSLLRFQGDPSIVYVDNLTGGVYLDEAADLERYSLVLDHLRATALDVRESTEFIKRVIADLQLVLGARDVVGLAQEQS